MSKKTKIFIGALLLSLGLVACGEKKPETPVKTDDKAVETTTETATTDEKVRMSLTAYRFDDNFISLFRRYYQEEADKQPDVNLDMHNAENTAATQNNILDVILEKGTDTLAINLVDPSGADVVLDKIKEKDVPVVFYNRRPSDEILNSYEKAFYVGIDPNAQGIAQGELIEKAWKADEKLDLNGDGVIQYVLLKGEPGHPDAEARTTYVIKTLEEKGIKTEELHLDTALWDTAMAKDKMDAWLSGPNGEKIEVIICNNDGMALGAIESMKAMQKDLPVFGVDALPEALVKIEAGEMAGTVLNDGKGQAFATFKLAYNLAKGLEATEGTDLELDGKDILIPSIGIDKENVAEFK